MFGVRVSSVDSAANVAWYVYPSTLPKADNSVISMFLEGSEGICVVSWIGGENLKCCSTHGNLRCVGLNYLFQFKLPTKTIEHKMTCSDIYMWANFTMLTPLLLTMLFLNYDDFMVISISNREKIRLDLFIEWISVCGTATFDRHIVNTGVETTLEHLPQTPHF